MKILLVEDNPVDAERFRRTIAGAAISFELTWVASLAEALSREDLAGFEVVLTDLGLPDAAGMETIQAIRGRLPSTPLVVLTSLTDDEAALHSLDLGAQDYLVKEQVTIDALERAIRYAVHRQEAVEENLRLLQDLEYSKKLLEAKNRRLQELFNTAQTCVDNVSHEFRTPLTVIKEYASLMRDGLPGHVNAEQRRMLSVIEDRADDLNTMVDDMLDVSKLESGLLGVWRKVCRLDRVVEHCLQALERKATVRSVSLVTDLGGDLPEVYCDDEKAGRVITNLVVNAIKFSPEFSTVRLWARNDEEHKCITVGVTDNGPGIPAEQVQAIFERFSRLDDFARGATKGFGLGLNIAKELVDLNLGRMTVDSTVGSGSTFSFTLPHANPAEVLRRYIARMEVVRRGEDPVISLMTVTCGRQAEPRDLDDVDRFLNYVLRRDDLLFRTARGTWLVVLPTHSLELDRFTERMRRSHTEVSRNRPRGPLPELDITVRGCWQQDAWRGDLLDEFRMWVETPEPAYA